jgi:hypothetical protein
VAPSPSPKPKSGGGLGKRLTRKVGPLPVWAWAAVILGAYLLWSRRSGGAATADTTAPTPTATSAGSDSLAQVPASGQGSSADNLNGVLLDQLSANTSSLDALTSQLLSAGPYQNFGDAPAAGTPPPPTGGEGGTRPDGTTSIAADVADRSSSALHPRTRRRRRRRAFSIGEG